MPDEAVQQAAQAVLKASTPKPHVIKDIFKLVYNEERAFSAIAIHAGPNKNYLFYDAENLAQIAKTQEGQSVTLGHDIYAVGSVTHAMWDQVGDEHGAKMDVRFIIQNHPQILEAINTYEVVLSINPGDDASAKRLAELKRMAELKGLIAEKAEKVAFDENSINEKRRKAISTLETWLSKIRELEGDR